MRTTRSGGKKAPQPKKDAAASTESAEETPETAAVAAPKPMLRSGPGKKGPKRTGKQSTPTAAASAAAAAAAAPIVADVPNPVPVATIPINVVPPAVATPGTKAELNEEEAGSRSAGVEPAVIAKLPETVLPGEINSSLPSSTKAAGEEARVMEPEEAVVELYPKTEDLEIDGTSVASHKQENSAVPIKSEEEQKSVTSSEEGETEKPSLLENEMPSENIKLEKGEGKAGPKVETGAGKSLICKEEDFSENVVASEEGDYMEEDFGKQEGFHEPGEGEVPREEEGEGVGEGEAGSFEEEEQSKMSDMINERRKKKELEIFVGGLDRDATEEDVRKAFENIGIVEDIRLHWDFNTNKNRGFAFVRFAEKEHVRRALSELRNPMICGKRCGIAPNEDNDTLFLGNICNTWTKEAIKRRLKEYGVDEVENITLVEDTQNEGRSRGFAFVEFSCHEHAMNAYKRLQKPDVVFGHSEWTAKVAFAEPIREPDAEVMAQVKSVFIDGMPPYWDEERVKERFKTYGEIERVVLARNMPNARRKDFGFVNFTTHEEAVACVEAVNNTDLGDGKSMMKARARLANPLPRTQAVKGGIRGGFRIGHPGFGSSGFGRGFGRGRLPFMRGGFQGARGSHFRGRGRGRVGRFSFPPDNYIEGSHFEFHGGRSFARGHEIDRSRRGGFDGGHARPFQMRREPFTFDGSFGGPFDGGRFGDDPYYHGEIGHGFKRPFSMMEHDSRYLEHGNRIRPRYNFPDALPNPRQYQDFSGGSSSLYGNEHYSSDYGGSGYSSHYGGRSGGGYYH